MCAKKNMVVNISFPQFKIKILIVSSTLNWVQAKVRKSSKKKSCGQNTQSSSKFFFASILWNRNGSWKIEIMKTKKRKEFTFISSIWQFWCGGNPLSEAARDFVNIIPERLWMQNVGEYLDSRKVNPQQRKLWQTLLLISLR
jgi:hypothetical protein